MDARADAALLRWGDWTARRDRSGLGFPSECVSFRLVAHGAPGSGCVVLADDEVMAIDRCVAGLRDGRPDLFWTAWLWYVLKMPVSVICTKAKCSERTFLRRKAELLSAITTVL